MPSGRRTTKKAQKRRRLLDLDTVAQDAPVIAINGVEYELLTQDTIDLRQLAQLKRAQELFTEMETLDPETALEGDEAEAEALLARIHEAFDRAVAIVVPKLPANVRHTLTDMQKANIMQVFTDEVVMPSQATESQTPN